MTDYWLENGRTKIKRNLTRSRAGNKNKEGTMARKHRRKAHRNGSRRSRRRSSRRFRSFHRNSPMHPAAEAAMALAAGLIALSVARKGSQLIAGKLPMTLPKKDLIGAGLVAAIVYAATEQLVKDMPKVRLALQLGAGIPLGEEAARAVGLGNLLGGQPVLLIPAPAAPGGGALPGPGMSAQLDAQLDEPYSQEY